MKFMAVVVLLMAVVVLLMNYDAASDTITTTIDQIVEQKIKLPLQPTKSMNVFCIGFTKPRTVYQSPLMAITGHSTVILQYGTNMTIVTAGLTGKTDFNEECIADPLLVKRKDCSYFKSPVTVRRDNCALIGNEQLKLLSAEMRKTLSPEFQSKYNKWVWNCANWALKTWNSLGLPVKVEFTWFVPIVIPGFL